MKRHSAMFMGVVWAAIAFALCTGCTARARAGGTILVTGAGATFPYPLYSRWFSDYSRVDPSATFNYQSIGSGGGIRQILDRTVDFGASDSPMTDEQMARASSPLVHVPTTLGAVVPVYNFPEGPSALGLSRRALAGIFLGTIRRWDDPEITRANPGVTLPAKEITVIHRSDGSGTSFIWTDFLSKISPEWHQRVGRDTSVRWPVGLGAKGNEGVAGLVRQTPYSVGYVELAYALQGGLNQARVENAAGELVACTPEAVTRAAAAAARTMPPDFRVSITDPKGSGVYPVSSFTWLLVYRDQPDPVKGAALKRFLAWMLHDGQAAAPALHYAPLPREVVTLASAAIENIQVARVER